MARLLLTGMCGYNPPPLPFVEEPAVSRTGVRLLAAITLTMAGCGIGQGQLAQQIFRPGPAPYQQQRAVKFDPFNEQNYVGTPDNSSRPRDYYQPNAEPSRGRWPTWGAPRFGFW
jgi:hypothetical protein